MPRANRKAAGLQAIPEDETVEESSAGQEVLAIIDELERNVEEKIHSIMAAATEAVFQLKQEFTKQMVHIPKKTREMPLSEFKRLYPEDFKTAALAQIGQKFAAMKENMAAKQVPAGGGRATRTTMKRAAEPETVLRTTRRKVAAPPMFSEPSAEVAAAPSEVALPETSRRSRSRSATEAAAAVPAAPPAAVAATKSSFNGRQLQTPMPFVGEALPAAVTLLTQKRGGRTRGAPPATDAAIVTTSDGQQWALGKQGLASIPESHRQEVQELLTAQFEFFAAALGKTVFARGRR